MSEPTAQQLLGWIYHRTRAACFSHKRSERDKALSDVNHLTQQFQNCWNGEAATRDPNRDWCGEQP